MPKVPVVRGAFDAASRSREANRHYAGADRLSADAALSPAVRHLIISRARHEVANNGFSDGILKTLASDTVGTGPRLQLFISDEAEESIDERNKIRLQRRLARWRDWSRAIKLTQKLKVARRAKAVDGEVFFRIIQNPKIRSHVKLDVQLYESEQVQGAFSSGAPQTHSNGVPKEVDGIVFDRYGNVSQYRFLKIHPGSNSLLANTSKNANYIPAEDVIHYANITRPGQNRGLTELASSLNVFTDLRRFTNATLASAEIAAEISFLLKTAVPEDDGSEQPESKLQFMDVVELKRGAGIALPEGWEGQQLAAEHPNDRYQDFCDSKLMEAARPLSMPFNLAKGNSSGYNYASGRLDHQGYHKSVNDERNVLEETILDRLLEIFENIDQIIYRDDYADEMYVFHSWMWDGFGHVDPVKEAKAAVSRLSSKTTTLQEENAKEGKNWEQTLRQASREKKMKIKLGLIDEPNPNAGKEKPEPKEEDDEDED